VALEVGHNESIEKNSKVTRPFDFSAQAGVGETHMCFLEYRCGGWEVDDIWL
jgi:hypothetical protein